MMNLARRILSQKLKTDFGNETMPKIRDIGVRSSRPLFHIRLSESSSVSYSYF